MPRPARLLVGLIVACSTVLFAACGSDGDASFVEPTGGRVSVFAAASLTDAFGAIVEEFESRHPGLSVDLNLAATSALREQVLAGAPMDVFAAADPADLERLVEADAVVEPRVFATNRLRLAVAPAAAGTVTAIEDFSDESLLLGLCAAEVPCGRYARQALAAAGVDPSIDTEEPDVRALLAKIRLGELDAGIVYATDVIAAGDEVVGVDLPEEAEVIVRYPIATATEPAHRAGAEEFVAFVVGSRGQAILRGFGFGPP